MSEWSVSTTALIGAVSLLYATAGQAGGTAFLAVMAISAFPAEVMRPTSLLLNIIAAGYATWRFHGIRAVDWSTLTPIALASLPAAFVGGLIVLDAEVYMTVTGILLLLAAMMMVVRNTADCHGDQPVPVAASVLAGVGVGLLSGLTGIGGGVFLAPVLIFCGWASPRRVAGLSPPFILANSIVGLAGTFAAGQRVASGVAAYAAAALAGAALGTLFGSRWMSQTATRYVLAVILAIAGGHLLLA
jgi:hypothetical protein